MSKLCGQSCTVKNVLVEHAFEVSSFLFFVGPMTLICVLYVLIGIKLRKSKLLQGVKRRSCEFGRGITGQTRVIRMLIAVAVAFFLCWAPFHAQRIMAVYGKATQTTNDRFHNIYTILTYVSGVLYFLSTCINPLLYSIMSHKFRDAFKNNRTVMELRFLPTSLTPAAQPNNTDNHLQHSHIQNNNCEPSPGTEQHNRRNQGNRLPPPPQPQPFNGTLMNGLPTIQNIGSTTEIGIPQVTDLNNRIPTSLRRTPRRTTGAPNGLPNGLPVPNSPRFMRSGISNDILHHNRSPIPSRVAAAVASSKRHRLGGRNNENISCGSLNSIEV